jgi:phage tail sheath protein FI
MAYQLSPGIVVTEKDQTTIVPAVSTSAGGFVGKFQWGPADQVTYVSSENELVSTFGPPNANNYASFFTAANFLAYSNQLLTIRAVGANAKNAVANTSAGPATADLVKSSDTYSDTALANALVSAKYAGTRGNSLKVVLAHSNNWSALSSTSQALFNTAPNTTTYAARFGSSFDEVHVAVIDEDGIFTSIPGTVLETFQYLSSASDATGSDGASIYYKQVLNDKSKYLWWRGHPNVGASWGEVSSTATNFKPTNNAAIEVSLSGGVDVDPTTGEVLTGYDQFLNDAIYDVSLLPVGDMTQANARSVINNIAEVRKDCVVFLSPQYASVAPNLSGSTAVTNALNDRTSGLSNISTSYAVMDSSWKYQYDRYNDVYRWVPMNGDTAGLCARTDFVADPWFSPAGLNRGQIKNIIKLSFNPNQSQRDILYKNGINPVISVSGQGTILYGDKTLLSKPSAFDRINVRRLFIVLEKAISIASRYSLFEFNDAFTRAQFRNLVEPFLRDVKGRRGITDFLVVCDETNNTGEVIDRNEFVADIYVKPARSINFISLNFIATRTSVSFTESGA